MLPPLLIRGVLRDVVIEVDGWREGGLVELSFRRIRSGNYDGELLGLAALVSGINSGRGGCHRSRRMMKRGKFVW